MAVIAHVVLEGVTVGQYDAVRAECGWLDEHPEGGIAHLSWWDGNDNHNMDAWESEEAFGVFGESRRWSSPRPRDLPARGPHRHDLRP